MKRRWKIGLISGTGEEGRGVALRLAAAGERVALGSRSIQRARQAALSLNRELNWEGVEGVDNRTLVEQAEILILSVPFRHASEVLAAYSPAFQEDQILVDLTVPVTFESGLRLLQFREGSGAEYLQSLLPDSIPVVAAFKTLPAHLLNDLHSPLDCDEFACSNRPEATQRFLERAGKIPLLRWIDAGPLRFSRALEGMTYLAIGLNRRYRLKASRFRVVGME